MKVMVDHNLPGRLAVALHTIFEVDGDEIVALRDKFGRSGVPDEEWITALGGEGRWAIISADMNIAKRRPSRDLVMRNGLVGFFLSPSLQKSPLHKQAARLLNIAVLLGHWIHPPGCQSAA